MAMIGQKANGRKLQARAMAQGLGPWPVLRAMPDLLGQGTNQIAKGQRLMAINLEPWPKILDIRRCAWVKPAGSERPSTEGVATLKAFSRIEIA